MRLYLVQHGEAVGKDQDQERPLSDQGKHDVERLAAFLARLGLRAARFYHSGKTRAGQTAELLQWAVAPNGRPEARSGLGPTDPVAPLAEEIAGWEADAAIAGHQPFLGRLLGLLTVGQEEAEVVAFTPATAVCLERGAAGGWQIAWVVPPELGAAEE